MMKYLIFLFLSLSLQATVWVSQDIHRKMPFSSKYSEDGALIYNVDFKATQEIKKQIEKTYGVTLEDRKEAHITVITPPEAKGTFNPNGVGINQFISTPEIQKTYSPFIQNMKFKIVCVGKLQKDDKLVFFLVVESKGLLNIRTHIQKELEKRAAVFNIKTYFKATDYTPHVTIGFIIDDIHGIPKDFTTCAEDVIEY